MKGIMGLMIAGLIFASLLPLAESQEQDVNVNVEWKFWRELIDPGTGEGVKSSGFAFTDTMSEVVWVKNTGTVPITEIKVKYLTVTEGQKVGNIPKWITGLIPSDCPRERSYVVDLKPGDEKKIEETGLFSKWVTEDLAYQGMHTIKEWDCENVTVIGDIKKGITLHDTEIDFSEADMYTEAELFCNGQSMGGKTIHFRIIPP